MEFNAKTDLKYLRRLRKFISSDVPDEMRTKIIKGAFGRVARFLKSEVEQNLQKSPYRLSRVFVTSVPRRGWYKNRRIPGINRAVIARSSKGSGYSAAWHEFGTNERIQYTTGRRTGRLKPQRFMERAMTDHIQEIIIILGKYASNKWVPEIRNRGREARIEVKGSRR